MTNIYRKIEIRMWGDEKFKRLTPIQPSGQSLWIYLLTGPHTGVIPGLSCIGYAALAEALGWEPEAFAKAFREVLREGLAKALPKDRLIWIPNAVKINPPASPNVVRSWASALNVLPQCSLLEEAIEAIRLDVYSLDGQGNKGFAKAFDEAFGEALPKGFAKGIQIPLPNQEQEQEYKQEQEEEREERASAQPPLLQNDGTANFEKAKAAWKAAGLAPSRKTLLEIGSEDLSLVLATLKNYRLDEIEKAIRNYSEILNSMEHDEVPRYQSLIGFLKNGVEKLVDDAKPHDAYRIRRVDKAAEQDDIWDHLVLTPELQKIKDDEEREERERRNVG
jgi:hypothetical protein